MFDVADQMLSTDFCAFKNEIPLPNNKNSAHEVTFIDVY